MRLTSGCAARRAVDALRETINRRIHAVLPGDRGSIASALITGKRSAISAPVRNAFYVSSLAHVLAISGFHMAVVTGIVFFFIRALLALIPSLAVRRPIKKWAAAGALLAATFYLVLSGAGVSTQRAFIMIAIVLIGVMADRPALTFRTLAVAAFGVLLISPQALVTPSFQMSFAATLALVAAYQIGLPGGLVWRSDADTPAHTRAALWGAREIAGLILASLVAGLATTPYAAFHFHRVAPYGVLANLAAMPVVSAWVMPMGILGVLALPFGFDAPFWHLMGRGIDWMVGVALWVTRLPGALGHVHAFGPGPLLLATAGLLLICLLRTPLRFAGAALMVGAGLWALTVPRVDVLISDDGRSAAVRGPDGRLSVLARGRDTFAIKEWLAADGDVRDVKDKSLSAGIACDPIGCVGHLADGRLASMVLHVEAFGEDCRRAAVVVSARAAQLPCAATLVDRRVWRAHGAVALRWDGRHFEETFARPPGTDRPWAPAAHEESAKPAAPRDATPKREDLEAGTNRRVPGAAKREQSERCAAEPGPRFDIKLGPGSAAQHVAGACVAQHPGQVRPSIPSEQPRQLALDANAIGWQDAHLVGRVGRFQRDGGAAPAEALQGGLLVVDQRHHDVAGLSRFRLADKRDIAIENAGVDHGVAAHLQGEMLAGGEQVGRHVDDVAALLNCLDRRAGGDAAHHRHRDRTAALAGVLAIRAVRTVRAHAAEVALDHARGEAARAVQAMADRIGQLNHLDGARPVGQPPDEAALLQRGDQPVDARFGAQIEGVLHLVEGGRNAGLCQPLVDEAQQLELLAGQHGSLPGSHRRGGSPREPKRKTNHERTLSVRYVFRKVLIWREEVERLLKAELKDDAG